MVFVYVALPSDGPHAYLDDWLQAEAPIPALPSARQAEESGTTSSTAVWSTSHPAHGSAFLRWDNHPRPSYAPMVARGSRSFRGPRSAL